MAWETDELVRELDGLLDFRIGGIEAGLADVLVHHALAADSPYGLGECGGHVGRQAHDLADLADRPPRAIVDDGCADRGAVPPVPLIDILDDLLAPVVLEIDIDVWRLAASLGDEAGKEKLDLGRIDLRDAEAIADDAARSRSSSLAKDAFLPRKGDDIVDRQEIACEFELIDESKLLGNGLLDLLWNPRRIFVLWIAFLRPCPGQIFEMLLRRLAGRHRLVGIFVSELAEREGAGVGDLDGSGDRIGEARKQPGHLGGGLEMPLGIDREPKTRFRDRAFLADTSDDVGELPALGHVIVHVIDGDERRARALPELVEEAKPARFIAAMAVRASEKHALRRGFRQCRKPLGKSGRKVVGRQTDEHLAFGGRQDVVEAEMAFALLGLAVALREQPAESPIGVPA